MQIALPLVIVVVVITATPTQTIVADQATPISSEAHKLYCQECERSCKHENANQLSNLSTDGWLATDDDEEPGSDDETLATLRCRCESVFDIKKRGFTCMNTSLAQAKLDRRKNQAHQGQKAGSSKPELRLEAKALAGSSQSGGMKQSGKH